jgi:aspartyl-tRNA(Asn)/glutamyl-tRNA(Gln) amidotransferase subunit C
MSDEVTREDVLRVAELANLELTAGEVPRMARDLSAILGHIAQLNELSTEGIPPMAQVSDVLNPAFGIAPTADGANLRADELRASLDRKAVMSQAPETDGRFFKVPKVIER